MSDLNDIIQVNITRETATVAQAGFGVPAIVDTFATGKTTPAFTRARSYASTKELLDDGWVAADAVYKMAVRLFAQNPVLPKIIVGRKDSGDASWDDALNAIEAENQDWYVLLATTGDADDALDIAEWVETQKKVYITRTADPDTLGTEAVTPGDRDLAAKLKDKGYDRTLIAYHGLVSGADEYLDAAWAGEALPYDPGSQTWAFKTPVGITADNLTSAQAEQVFARNANTYQVKGGRAITRWGTVASGEYMDIIRGVDWLEARIQEALYSLLVNARKVPFDDSGIFLVASTVEGVLAKAEAAGVLIPGTAEVTAPKYEDIDSADKARRNLPDVKFTGLLQGAIHKIKVNGTVSL